MKMDAVRSTLARAAALLAASGARPQSDALASVERLLADSGDKTVGEFVERTQTALNLPTVGELPPDVIVRKLDDINVDTGAFAAVMADLRAKNVTKEKAVSVALEYTGALPTRIRTKADALKAIQKKFDERVYLTSKETLNSTVTPW
jgi:hypothetical protein